MGTLTKRDKDLKVILAAYDVRQGLIQVYVNGLLTQYEIVGNVEAVVEHLRPLLRMRSYREAMDLIRRYKKPRTTPRVDIRDGVKILESDQNLDS